MYEVVREGGVFAVIFAELNMSGQSKDAGRGRAYETRRCVPKGGSGVSSPSLVPMRQFGSPGQREVKDQAMLIIQLESVWGGGCGRGCVNLKIVSHDGDATKFVAKQIDV